jgi:hypothetical protein
MTSPGDVPYADPEPMTDLIEEGRCVEAECQAHGVDLHPGHHHEHHGAEPVVVAEDTSHIVEGISDYGS